MRVLKARYRDKEGFLEAFDRELPHGGIFCPTTKPLHDDEEVVVEVHFPGLPNKMMLRGTVVSWRPALPRLGVRAGAIVAFTEEEAEKKSFIVEAAEGGHVDAVKRKHTRLPVEQAVRWRRANDADSVEGIVRDISIGGAQLVIDEGLEVGEDVTLELTMPGGAGPINLAAKVTSHTPGGYGLKFVYRDGGGSRRLREMVRRLVEPE